MSDRKPDIRLQVMICTFRKEGLCRVASMTMPRVTGVEYLVSCQSDVLPLPEALLRDDVKVIFTPTLGLSNNRNNALDAVTAEYALIADDDLVYNAAGLESVIRAFDSNPGVDIATFRCDYPTPRIYPDTERDHSVPFKDYQITSFEIALRISSIRRAGLRFSPDFGIGAPYLTSGEENVFLLEAERAGLRGRFFPVTIVKHPGPTTTQHSATVPGVIRAQGAYIRLRFSFFESLLRLLLKAKRIPGSYLRNLRYLWQGWSAI